jgi:hypothetical protein
MGLRFRRSIRRRGATVNFSTRATRTIGSGRPAHVGISYSTMLRSGPDTALPRQERSSPRWATLLVLVIAAAMFAAALSLIE